MTPERWQQVKDVLDKALSLQLSERAVFLDAACAGDSEMLLEVESLLNSHQATGARAFDTPAFNLVDTPQASGNSPIQTGRRIGPYLLLEELGHGGMGEVFSAVRADGQFDKRVAIKFVHSGYGTKFILERFRRERQILANLDHPNVARLIDGGTTEDGIPYLVMELVDGMPIDEYCDAHKLNTTERLQLFVQVCGAVHYAHQHLVIHRDIKPSNIFVTQDGIPKLLDFGIAKIFDPTAGGETSLLRPMTPEYASPEQIRDEPMTTATDIYSLGVVLFRLLTGHSPYNVAKQSAAKLAEAITGTEPERPSASVQRTQTTQRDGAILQLTPETVSSTREASPARLQQRLRGDIDFILLKALRKEPSERYSSVEWFSDDIHRHLEGLPVKARKGTWNYRATKFLRRHRIAVIAASLVFATIVAGIAITVRETLIAQANRRRAEARFNDVRKLANSLIFEVNDSIQNLPGTTQPRKLILQRAVEYLDSLSRESGNDLDLQRELATGYERIANLQGNPMLPNLGETKAALTGYQKAIALRESLVRSDPQNDLYQVDLAVAYVNYSEILNQGTGNTTTAFEYLSKAVAILDRAAAASPSDLNITLQATMAYMSLGVLQIGNGLTATVGTVSGGVDALDKALMFDQRALQLSPENGSANAEEAVITTLLAEAFVKLGDRAKALTYYRRALDILNALNQKSDNIRTQLNAVGVSADMATALLAEGKTSEATALFAKDAERAQQLAARDLNNESTQRMVVTTSAQLGHALVEEGRFKDGLAYLHKASALLEAQPTQKPLVLIFQSQAHAWLGEAAERQGHLPEAAQEYAQSKEKLATLSAAGANDLRSLVYFSGASNRLAGTELKLGNLAEAKKGYDESLALLEPLSLANPDNTEVLYLLADTYSGEGDVAQKLASSSSSRGRKSDTLSSALECFHKSQQTWSRVPNPARISTTLFEGTLPAEVSRRLAVCNAQLASLNTATGAPSRH